MNEKSRNILHYDPYRIDYAVSETELDMIEKASNNDWKDYTLAGGGLSFPFLINGVLEYFSQAAFKLTGSLFINCLLGMILLVATVICGLRWYRTKSGLADIIKRIKSKPPMTISVDSTSATITQIDGEKYEN